MLDANNEPLPGVNVVQTGTTNGTITDLDGKYSLSVPSDATLTFSYIGFTNHVENVNGSHQHCYCYVVNGEMWVKGMNISPYFYGSYANHEAKRDRKLLLNRREIRKLEEATKQPGYTIVPTLLFIDENGRAKLDIALCRGKKEYDKRQTLKEKEDRREMDRAIKHF